MVWEILARSVVPLIFDFRRAHAEDTLVFVFFVVVCSLLFRDDTSCAEGSKEQVLPTVVHTLGIRRSVYVQSVQRVISVLTLNSVLESQLYQIGV